MSTSSRLTAATAGNGQSTTSAPTWSNARREMIPKVAVASSIAANNGNRPTCRRFEIHPPARLPSPRPSMKAETTMVTDSELTPKIRNSARCQVN
jgi:hypothetical protein